MSAISTQLPGSYYQLNNTGAGSNGANTARSVTPSLAAALSGKQAASSSFSDAVFLDLSPAAQKYLSGLGSAAATKTQDAAGQGADFVLSVKQRATLNEIIDKYKDAPYTQATFDAIQDDLLQAGLGPDQLSAQDRSKSFNSTAVLIDALNGGKGELPGSVQMSEETLKTKSANYIQNVVSQWKRISTDYAEQQEQNADAVAPIGSADGAS